MHLVLLGLLDESFIHLVSFKNVHTNISINVGPINAYVLALAAAEKGKNIGIIERMQHTSQSTTEVRLGEKK